MNLNLNVDVMNVMKGCEQICSKRVAIPVTRWRHGVLRFGLRFGLAFSLVFAIVGVSLSNVAQASNRISQDSRQKIQRELPILGLSVGDEVFVRVFKQESQLELWMRPKQQTEFVLFRTYPICYYSGGLGPKIRTGDKISPEGFYGITASNLNPFSNYHLSMDMGFPNAYDRFHGRTGSLLMIHGACDSRGCFAMGNAQIEEIYFLVKSALKNGQSEVPVHAFPFRLSLANLKAHQDNQWYPFWLQLKAGYDEFNQTYKPPSVSVINGEYVIGLPTVAGQE